MYEQIFNSRVTGLSGIYWYDMSRIGLQLLIIILLSSHTADHDIEVL